MSRITVLALLLVLAAALCSCSGSDGATGPAGNANVMMFNFPAQTSSGARLTYDFAASQAFVESSIILAYYNPSDQDTTCYYAVPGLGSNGAYMTRSWWYRTNPDPSTYTYFVNVKNPNGTGDYPTPVTFQKFKLIIVPASKITEMTTTVMDLSDYKAVTGYLGLK